MRVAFITNLCPHYRRPLFERLSDAHEVDFFFFADERERYWNRNLGEERQSLQEIELRRFRVMGQPFMPGVGRVLSQSRYDVVVKCLNGRLMVPYTYLASRVQRLPLVLWTGMWYHPRTITHRLTRPLTEEIYRRADAVVTYGDHVRRFLLGVRGVRDEKLFVAGQAVDGSRFRTVTAVSTEVPEFLYIGQFEERKGIRVLLDAVDALSGTSVRLVLIGSGPLDDEIRRRVGSGSSGSVEIVGHVAQDGLPAYLARARALVVPSITTRRDREPWGLVVNEAMHAGVPVIASDAVGAAAGGLVEDGRNGFIVPEGNAAALSALLRQLAADGGRANELGAAGRQDVERFSYDAMVEAFSEAMDYAVHHSRKPTE